MDVMAQLAKEAALLAPAPKRIHNDLAQHLSKTALDRISDRMQKSAATGFTSPLPWLRSLPGIGRFFGAAAREAPVIEHAGASLLRAGGSAAHATETVAPSILSAGGHASPGTGSIHGQPSLGSVAAEIAPSILSRSPTARGLSAMWQNPGRTILGAGALGAGGFVANQHLSNAANNEAGDSFSPNYHRWANRWGNGDTTHEQAFNANANPYGVMHQQQVERINAAQRSGNHSEMDRLIAQLGEGNYGGNNNFLPWDRDRGWNMPRLGGLNPFVDPNAGQMRTRATASGSAMESQLGHLREYLRDPNLPATQRESLQRNLDDTTRRMLATQARTGLSPTAPPPPPSGNNRSGRTNVLSPYASQVINPNDGYANVWEAHMRQQQNEQNQNLVSPLTR